MPPQSPRTSQSMAGDVFDAFAADRSDMASADVPVDAAADARSRSRTRRGGPRTPLPLLPLIGIATGVGIAYVAQTAHITQSSYQASALETEHRSLQQDDRLLGDQLDRLRSAERIAAAAQQLGMLPPSHWNYVSAAGSPVTVPPAPGPVTLASTADPVQRLVAALSGSFGAQDAEAAGR